MKVMIMAAGKGTRLHPITDLVPKPMAPIVNRPALFHIIGLLRRHGLVDIILNLHHLPEVITGYFGDGGQVGVNLSYSFEPELMGTAGGVKNNQSFLDGDTFVVMSGDAVTDIDLTGLIAAHKREGSIATLAVKEVANPSLYGVVLADDDGRVVGFQEKPSLEEARSHLCNCGIYVFEPEIFDQIPAGQFDDFGSRLFPDLLREHIPFHIHPTGRYWNDVGNLTEFMRSNVDALSRRVEVEIPGAEVRPGFWIEGESAIDDGVLVEPPVLVGRSCKISEGAVLEGPLVVGDGCRIEEGCHLVNGVVLPNSLVPEGSILVGGVLGQRFTARERGR
ncbi:MAG: NDP-sugar synthase [Actinobacteria bacterium]|nr:NDP-sugar synthase [Actinomycetota bacterium]